MILCLLLLSDETEEGQNKNYHNTFPFSMQFTTYTKEGKDYYTGNVACVRISLWIEVK